ncbi:response regulator [Methylocystis parvus]|uniref:Response regulator n=2 Tax=Methylocystis parvus TaxID=134 RepID=A0A6B8MB27_9HYPH|nr:response regulator [Methylocystis parvus]
MQKETANRRVFVVDDEEGVRNATALLLQMEGYEVEIFPSASAFLESISAPYDGCVITDVRMPGMDGVELIAQLHKKSIPLPAIVVTAYADVPLAVQAMKLGACDLLTKPFDLDALLAALDTAFNQKGSDEGLETIRDRLSTLTHREAEVLRELLVGRSNKEIAHNLGISARTAEAHRANIMAKTRARGLAGLIKMAVAADPAQLHGLVATGKAPTPAITK